jgi:hypothetical protein
VLNLTVAMITKILIAIFSLFVASSSGAALPENIVISYPANGDSVQGVVEIKGTVISDIFSAAEVYFGYANKETENWFLISRLDQPVENGQLARWDTTTITDGEYQIKLVLYKKDGSTEKVTIAPVYVRNYSIEPTTVAVPTNVSANGNSVGTSTPVGFVFATPLPMNPAATSEDGTLLSIIIGIVLCLLILLGLLAYRFLYRRNRLL